MAMTRYEPFTRFTTLRDAVDRMIDEAFGRTGMARFGAGMLPIDMFERQDELMVQAALPGVKPEDVEISITPDSLTIRGTIHTEAEKEESGNWNWYFRELDYGTFTRTISLPFPVSPDKADAHFENGMLYIKLPKSEEARPKRIQVQGGKGQARQIDVSQQQGGQYAGQQQGSQYGGQQQGGQQGGRQGQQGGR